MSTMKFITINSKIENKGHYVLGVIAGGMLYISGQLPVHHETGLPPSDGVAQQTADALHNVELVLKPAGLKREDVVMCRVYIPDVTYWDTVKAAYAAFFGSHKPARVMFPSGELHNGVLVEIKAVAAC